MEIKIANNDDRELWDRMVERSVEGSIFHKWDFLKIAEKHSKTKLYPLIGLNGTHPCFIYPIFFQKKSLVKLVFSPPPRVALSYLGPVMSGDDNLKQTTKETLSIDFQKSADQFISGKLGADYVYVSVSPQIMDSRAFKWVGYSIKPRYSYCFKLTDIDSLWANMDKDRRTHINRAIKEGITVELGSKEELLWIYEQLCKRYSDQGRAVQVSKDYFSDFFNLLHPKNLRILVAKYKGEIVSGTIDAVYKDRTYSWIGSPKPPIKTHNVNELLTWESIKYALNEGSKYYELIGIATSQNLYKHYSKLNPLIYPYFSATKSTPTSRILETCYSKIIKPAKSLKARC